MRTKKKVNEFQTFQTKYNFPLIHSKKTSKKINLKTQIFPTSFFTKPPKFF